MKLLNLSMRSRVAMAVSFIASTLLLSGCIESGRFAWTPDGSQAAMCANDGLRFCDATGKISGTQLKTPDELAWHRDGKHLIVVTHVDGLDWDALAPQLPAKRRALVESEGELFLGQAKMAGMVPATFGKALHDKITKDAIPEILLYLKAKHSAELKDVFGKDWTDYAVNPATLYTLATYERKGDILDNERVIWRSTKTIQSPRVRPNSDTQMIVVNDSRNLYLLDQDTEPRLLVEGSSRYPDWSTDGNHIYFFLESSDKTPDSVARIDATKLTATTAGATATPGVAPTTPAIEKLTSLKYYKDARVRCLPDGGVLLATADATSKTKPDVFGRKTVYIEQVHRLAAGSTKLVSVSNGNEFVNKCGYCSFEVSPDATKVVLATENGSIKIMPLPSGAAKEISPDNNNPSPFAPCWRTNEELCFASGAPNGDSRDVVLYNLKSASKTAISLTWPKTAVAGVLSKEEAQQNRFEDFLNSLYQ